MNGSTGVLLLRTVVSLAVVLGLLWVAARVIGGRNGRSPVRRGGRRVTRTAGLQVITRTGLAKGSSIAVVEVAGRTLVLGVTAQSVSVLASDDAPLQLDGDGVEDAAVPAGAVVAGGTGRLAPWLAGASSRSHPPTAGRMPTTPGWKPVLDALRERTVRRP